MPRSASWAASSAGPTASGDVQPSAATRPPRASTAATTRSPWAAAIAAVTLRVTNRGRAQHHALDPGRDRLLDLLRVPQPATELHRDVRPRRRSWRTWSRLTGSPARAPSRSTTCSQRRAGVGPAAGGVERVVVVGGLALVIALHQADGAAVEDVDRRDRGSRSPLTRSARSHSATRQICAKFSSIRRPAALDFSGWNCAP